MKIIELHTDSVLKKSGWSSEEEIENYEHWECGNYDDSFKHGQLSVSVCAMAESIHFIESLKSGDDKKSAILALNELSEFINSEIKSINDSVKNELDAGNEVSGFAFKDGRVSRSIKSEEDLINGLVGIIDKEDLFESKIIGLPKVENMLTSKGIKPKERKEILSRFVVEKEGKKSLVIVD